jgi:hypothetical protein
MVEANTKRRKVRKLSLILSMMKKRSLTELKLIKCLRKQSIDQTKRIIRKRRQISRPKLNNLKNKEKLKSKNIKTAHKVLENRSSSKKEKYNLEKNVWRY